MTKAKPWRVTSLTDDHFFIGERVQHQRETRRAELRMDRPRRLLLQPRGLLRLIHPQQKPKYDSNYSRSRLM